MKIIPYQPELRERWDSFIKESRNGNFLFDRNYMDYHSDRFSDFSLILADDRDNIMAVLPANREGDTVCSHRGLTYGGWIFGHREPDAVKMLEGWNLMLEYLRDNNVRRLEYRPVPHIYHRYPAEEDLYALIRSGGKIEVSPVSSVIDLRNPIGFDKSVRRYSRKKDIIVSKSNDFSAFWKILTNVLQKKHNSKPVHTLAEIEMLHNRFPENITLHLAYKDGTPVAGAVLYHCGRVIKSQYGATTDEGRHIHALTTMFARLISELPEDMHYFDFGTSNEDGGNILNTGLLEQKASFGARAVIYPHYILTL